MDPEAMLAAHDKMVGTAHGREFPPIMERTRLELHDVNSVLKFD